MGPLNMFSMPASMMSSFVSRGTEETLQEEEVFLPASDVLLLADSCDVSSFSSTQLLLHRQLPHPGCCFHSVIQLTRESVEISVSPAVPYVDHQVKWILSAEYFSSLLPSAPHPYPLSMPTPTASVQALLAGFE